MTEVLIVRHGQASFATDDYDRLTDIGWQQSRLLGKYFSETEKRFDAVFTGSLRRQKETLAGIAESGLDLPEADELPGLNEYDFHVLVDAWLDQNQESIDRSDSRQFYRTLRKALLSWSRDELYGAPESWDCFEQRVKSVMADCADRQGRVLVISSGGPISAMMRAAHSLDVETMVNVNLQAINTGVTRYYCKNGQYRLNSFNALPHLDNKTNQHLITYT